MIYYSIDNKVLGPVAVEHLHELFRQGRIGIHTQVIRVGAREWTSYRTELNASSLVLEPAWTPPRTSRTVPPGHHSAIPSPLPVVLAQPCYRGLVKSSWILLGSTALLSLVPVLGFAAWVIAGTVALITVILAIITLSRGGTRDGIFVLLTTLFVFPVFILVAPLVSTGTAAAAASPESKPGNHPSFKVPARPMFPFSTDKTGLKRP